MRKKHKTFYIIFKLTNLISILTIIFLISCNGFSDDKGDQHKVITLNIILMDTLPTQKNLKGKLRLSDNYLNLFHIVQPYSDSPNIYFFINGVISSINSKDVFEVSTDNKNNWASVSNLEKLNQSIDVRIKGMEIPSSFRTTLNISKDSAKRILENKLRNNIKDSAILLNTGSNPLQNRFRNTFFDIQGVRNKIAQLILKNKGISSISLIINNSETGYTHDEIDTVSTDSGKKKIPKPPPDPPPPNPGQPPEITYDIDQKFGKKENKKNN